MKVLIVDEMHPSIVEMTKSLGLDVDYFPKISKKEIFECIAFYEGIILRSKFSIDEFFLEKATKLKFIGRAGAGLDLIDMDACFQRNIEVFAANEGNRIAVAEHLIGMILCLFNKINTSDIEVRQGIWRREANRGEELFGKKVGIIGYGNNGQAFAERLIAFGCEVLAFDKFRYGFGNQFVKECSMDEIFNEAEIVSLHIPLTEETNQMVNSAFLKKFKKQIFFCNIARGEIVVLKDLVDGLENGIIRGACLDVLENEKLKNLTKEQHITFEKLISLQNVILTPHIAGWTHESYRKISEVLRDKIERYLKA